jgi:hypothetical protein
MEGFPDASLSGMYFSTHTELCGMPVYHKADGSETWIVFDARSLTWRVLRGAKLELVAYVRCLKDTPLENCTRQEWRLRYGDEFKLFPALRLRPVDSDSQYFAYGQLVRIQGLVQVGFVHEWMRSLLLTCFVSIEMKGR